MLHRVVDQIADGITNGASGLVNSISGGIRGVGKSVMTGLDKPFTDLTGKEGPHRVLDRAADGFMNAGTNFVNQGIIGTAKTAGKGIMRALDQPLEQIKGMNNMRLPWQRK